MQTVYIETTIISYLTARPSRDLIRAAHQQITREWWENDRHRYELFTGQMALIEAAAGDPEAAADRLAVLHELPLLMDSADVPALAQALISATALPAVAGRDAVHVATAATTGMDYLLTRNCRHLANASLRDKISAVCRAEGFRAPIICTPEELREVVE
ncbi:MAG: DNA-binding protein [Phycisphaerales bacterium]|nr:MAG: DNA-binding protein [Phycisphaerales bacterium]